MDDLKIALGFFGRLFWGVCQMMFAGLVLVPLLVARKIWRWQRLPQHKRDAINAAERAAIDRGWDQVELLIRAELIAHGLPDTPANRAKLNAGRARRRK